MTRLKKLIVVLLILLAFSIGLDAGQNELAFSVGLYAGQNEPRLRIYKQQKVGNLNTFQTWIITDTRNGNDYLVVCGTGCAVTPLVPRMMVYNR